MKRIQFIVKVVDETGTPVDGAFITIESSEVVLPEIALLTNTAGELELTLPPGIVRVRADADERSVVVERNMSEGGEHDDATVLLKLPCGNE